MLSFTFSTSKQFDRPIKTLRRFHVLRHSPGTGRREPRPGPPHVGIHRQSRLLEVGRSAVEFPGLVGRGVVGEKKLFSFNGAQEFPYLFSGKSAAAFKHLALSSQLLRGQQDLSLRSSPENCVVL